MKVLASKKKYSGIGARKTPKKILNIMTKVAKKLSKMNFILRSGGAIVPIKLLRVDLY